MNSYSKSTQYELILFLIIGICAILYLYPANAKMLADTHRANKEVEAKREQIAHIETELDQKQESKSQDATRNTSLDDSDQADIEELKKKEREIQVDLVNVKAAFSNNK